MTVPSAGLTGASKSTEDDLLLQTSISSTRENASLLSTRIGVPPSTVKDESAGKHSVAQEDCNQDDVHVQKALSLPTSSTNSLTSKAISSAESTHDDRPAVHEQPTISRPKKPGSREPKHTIKVDGRKRYPCTFPGCNKTFSTSGHCIRHSRIHTGERPYHCTYPGCNAKFSRYDNSLQHYRIHIITSKRGKKKLDASASGLAAEQPSGQILAQAGLREEPNDRHSDLPARSDVLVADGILESSSSQGNPGTPIQKPFNISDTINHEMPPKLGSQPSKTFLPHSLQYADPRSSTVSELGIRPLAPANAAASLSSSSMPNLRKQLFSGRPLQGELDVDAARLAPSSSAHRDLAPDRSLSDPLRVAGDYWASGRHFGDFGHPYSVPFKARRKLSLSSLDERSFARGEFSSPQHLVSGFEKQTGTSQRDLQFRMNKSGSLPSLLSLDMSRPSNHNSLSRYSLAGGGKPPTTASPARTGRPSPRRSTNVTSSLPLSFSSKLYSP